MICTRGYGISVEYIDESCPREMECYVKAYQMEQKKIDEMNWINGRYVISAILQAADIMFNGKKAKQTYIDKPILQNVEENAVNENKELTEEEKIEYTKKVFLQLQMMQANFELNKQNDKGKV